MSKKRAWLIAAAVITLSCAVIPLRGTAFASSFQIDPVKIDLEADKATATLRIVNNGDRPTSVRISALSWTQKNSEDVYSETDEIVASPPIATILPHKTQIIRLGQRERTAGEERAYRIIVEEIPQPSPSGTGIDMALRFNLPMYVAGARRAYADLSWTAWLEKDGKVTVEAVNKGDTHVKLLELGWGAGNGSVTLAGSTGVILAKGSKRWSIPLTGRVAPGVPAILTIRTDDGETQSPLTPQAR